MPGATTATTLYSHAAITPIAINENMLRRIVRNEVQPRARNGRPLHSTTGVPSTNSAQSDPRSPNTSRTAPKPRNGPIARASSGIVNTAPIRNLRVKSTSSGFGPSSGIAADASSRAMPQIGQEPGCDRRMSGCIGQV